MSAIRCTVDVMARGPAGHIERLPSGSWRVKVYAGTDPLTGGEIRLRKTCKTNGRPDRARQAARAGRSGTPARLGRHRGPVARPVCVDSRVGRVHPGKQPRVYPPDHQTCPWVHAGPQGPRPAAGHVVRPADAVRQPRVYRQAIHRAPQHPGPQALVAVPVENRADRLSIARKHPRT